MIIMLLVVATEFPADRSAITTWLTANHGWGPKIARVAVMRRMATIIWHMLTKRKTWAEVRSLGISLQT